MTDTLCYETQITGCKVKNRLKQIELQFIHMSLIDFDQVGAKNLIVRALNTK